MRSLILIASAAAMGASPLATTEAEVQREKRQNVQIHDAFQTLETGDEKAEKKIKANRNLVMLQTSPLEKVRAQVNRDSRRNIRISESFSDQEKQDIKAEKAVRANRSMSALQTSPAVLARQINDQRRQNTQIHDVFQAQEHEDDAVVKRTEADKSMKAFLQKGKWGDDDENNDDKSGTAIDRYVAEFSEAEAKAEKAINLKPHDFTQDLPHTTVSSGSVISIPLSSQLQESFLQTNSKTKTAPGVAATVNKARMWDVYIHDTYADLEAKDKKEERRIRHSRDLQA